MFALFISASSIAKTGVAPYLTEKLSPAIEQEVERLAVIAGIPNLTRPYNLATIFHYLDTIRVSHPGLHSRLSVALKPYERKLALTHARIGGNYSEDAHRWANQRGNDTDTVGHISLRSQWQVANWLGIYAGAYATNYRDGGIPDDVRVSNGSYISMGTHWAQLDIGYRDLWLSPFQGSAQLLSTNAATMPSVSLSNNLPIEFLGVRWQYHTFLAQMGQQPVLFDEVYTEGDRPLLAGVHIGMQPTAWWSLGATRLFQFAGGERPRDFKTLLRAFYDPRGADNDASVDEESGNQLASVVSKINFDGPLPFSFAVELAGEDTNNAKDYQLGNTAVTAGFFFPYFFSEKVSLAVEYSDWQVSWYSNNVYKEGFTNDEYVLGTWAMQAQRDNKTANEGRSYYMSVHYQLPNDHLLYAQLRQSEHKRIPEFETAWELELDYSLPIKSHLATFGVHMGKDNVGADFSRVSVSLEW